MKVQETLDRLGLYWKRDPDFVPVFYTNTRNKKASRMGGFFVENRQTWKISIEIKRF